MKTLKICLLILSAIGTMASCREQKNESPTENYEMNHKTEEAADSSFSKTDTIISNSTQTDPASTD